MNAGGRQGDQGCLPKQMTSGVNGHKEVYKEEGYGDAGMERRGNHNTRDSRCSGPDMGGSPQRSFSKRSLQARMNSES